MLASKSFLPLITSCENDSYHTSTINLNFNLRIFIPSILYLFFLESYQVYGTCINHVDMVTIAG